MEFSQFIDLQLNEAETGSGFLDPWSYAIKHYRTFYKTELLDSIFSSLKIYKIEDQYGFFKDMCFSIGQYCTTEHAKQKNTTQAYQFKEFHKFKKSINQAIKSLQKIEENYMIGSYAALIHDNLDNMLEADKNAMSSLSNELKVLAAKKRPAAVWEDQTLMFLQKIYEAILNVDENQISVEKTERRPLMEFLTHIADTWQIYSPIPLIAGSYYENIGYNSEAMHIIQAIIEPIDDNVTLQNIATELRYLNKANDQAK